MSAAPVLQDSSWDELVEMWQRLDVPEGWRAEIVKEGIMMSPPPDQNHNLIGSRVHKALVRAIPDDWEILQTQGIFAPFAAKLLVPDVLVVPRERMTSELALPGDDALLTVEITSKGTAGKDREEKLHAYARAGIPLYLLIDRFADRWPTVTLYSDPAEDVYQAAHAVPFGKPVTLPEPFDVTIETEDFPR